MPFKSGRTAAVSSFNYSDIATGKSFVNYFGGKASGSYLLMTNRGYSETTHTTGDSGGLSIGSDTPAVDIDFDVTLDRPRLIEGKTMISVPLVIGVNQEIGVSGKLVVTVRKVSGGTESDLVEEVTATESYTGEAASNYWRKFIMQAVIVDIPRTKFKKDDILRLTVRAFSDAAANGGVGGVGHDPKSRDFILKTSPAEQSSTEDTTESDLQFPVPFVLDV